MSAIINYRGEIEDSIEYGKEWFINTNVGLIEEKTFYVNYGDYIFRISLCRKIMSIYLVFCNLILAW